MVIKVSQMSPLPNSWVREKLRNQHQRGLAQYAHCTKHFPPDSCRLSWKLCRTLTSVTPLGGEYWYCLWAERAHKAWPLGVKKSTQLLVSCNQLQHPASGGVGQPLQLLLVTSSSHSLNREEVSNFDRVHRYSTSWPSQDAKRERSPLPSYRKRNEDLRNMDEQSHGSDKWGKQLLFHLSPSPVCARLHYSQRLKSTGGGGNTAGVKKICE